MMTGVEFLEPLARAILLVAIVAFFAAFLRRANSGDWP